MWFVPGHRRIVDMSSSFPEHNQIQRDYFEARIKPRMVPRDTPYIRRQVDELLRFSGIGNDDRVLEVGCGMGRYTLPLAGAGVRIEGLDLSGFLLERLEEYNAGRFHIPTYCADVLQFPRSLEGSFDAVTGVFTLHHLPDLTSCFGAMRRLLRPGGRLTFLEPNALNALYYFQIIFTPGMKWKGDKGLLKMRRGLVSKALGQAGFENFSMKRFGFFPPILANLKGAAFFERALQRIALFKPFLPFQLFGAVRGLDR